MTLPQKHDLAFYRGDTERWQYTVLDGDTDADRADLTGVTFKAEIRDKPGGPNLLAVLEVSSPDPTTGVIVLAASSALTAAMAASGSWDLQLTYPGGDIRTLIAGKVKVTMDVTDSYVAPVGLRAVK